LDFVASHALIVGIDSYGGGIPPLGNAVRDARAVAEALANDHHFTVTGLFDGDATFTALGDALDDLLPSEVGPDDRVLVYFAGHGIAQDGDDGPEGFLVPVDATPEDRASLFPMLRLHQALAALPCRHLLLVLDCCFAGSFRWTATRSFLPGAQTMFRKRYERFVGEPAWQVLTSTAPDQKALDLLDGLTIGTREMSTEHSPFAAALLDGLAGGADRPGPDGQTDGVVTATELYMHVRDVVELGAEAQGKMQTPGLWPLPKHARGEFLFHVPGREPTLLPDPILDASANPWPGLAAYHEHQAHLFFGRTRVVDQLRERLQQPGPLIAVIGASGTGKSSVVRAGLAARARVADDPWTIIGPLRPGDSPLVVLDELEAELADVPITQPALVLLDQFEEIYTLCRDPYARTRFLNRFCGLLDSLPDRVKVVLTARSDFLPQLRSGPLADRIEACRFTVPPMTTDELREVVEGPAQARVLYFEPPSLVDRVVDEVVAMPGALPLLSFTLSELYYRYLDSNRDDRALRAEDYDALGGVVGSLRTRASELYASATPEEQKTIENVMVRLVAVEGGELAKRRVDVRELEYPSDEETARARTILARFTEARLLLRSSAVADAGVSRSWVGDEEHTWVEPTHDMLVIAWDRVHLWLDQLGPEVHLQRDLWRQASTSTDPAQGALWHDDPRLPIAETLLDRPGTWLNRVETLFVRASVRRRDRNVRRRRWAIAAFVIVVLAGVIGVLLFASEAFKARSAAQMAQATAESERDQALKLTMLAGAQTAVDPTTSAVLLRDLGSPDGLPLWSYVVTAAIDQPIARQAFQGHRGAVTRARFDPSGNRVLTTSEDGSARIWPLSDVLATDLTLDDERGPRIELKQSGGAINDGTWSPDGRWVVTGAASGQVTILDSSTGKVQHELQGPGESTLAVAWSPDGRYVAATGAFGGARIWASTSGALVMTAEAPANRWSSHLSWKPDSTHLAVAGTDGWAVIADVETATTTPLTPPKGYPHIDWLWVEYAPNGESLALAGENGQAGVWNDDGEQIATHNAPRGRVDTIRWSPDGHTIVTAGADHIARLWSPGGTLRKELTGHRGAILHVAFVPAVNDEPATLLTASMDNTVRSWGVDKGVHRMTFRGHAAGVRRVDVRADGGRFVTASGDWTARLWSPRNASESVKMPIVGQDVYDLEWSPECSWLGSSSANGLSRLFAAPGRGRPITHKLGGASHQLTFSQDGQWMAAGSSAGEALIRTCKKPSTSGRDCAEWEERVDVLVPPRHGDAVDALAWGGSPPFLVAAYEDGIARIWRPGASLREPSLLVGHSQPLTTVAVSSDGARVATGSRDRTVLLWDPTAPDEPMVHWRNYGAAIRKVAFSPDGTRLAAIIEGAELFVHALDEPPKALGRHQGRIADVAWNHAGTQLVTGSSDHTARIWDAATGEVLHELKGHTGPVRQVRFTADDSSVLSGSYDNTVRMWPPSSDGATRVSQVVEAYDGAVTAIEPGCAAGQVFSGAADGSLRNTQMVSTDQQRKLLRVVTDYCIPPGQAQQLTGSPYQTALDRYSECLSEQEAGASDAQPGVPAD
jgi:WD40 repeat protein